MDTYEYITTSKAIESLCILYETSCYHPTIFLIVKIFTITGAALLSQLITISSKIATAFLLLTLKYFQNEI